MKTIIVATDFSEAALNAARYAAMLTRQLPVTRLLLYHSYHDMLLVIPSFSDSEYYAKLQEDFIERLNEIKDMLTPLVAKNVTIDCLANISPLQDAIGVDFLKEEPQMIVMGITGKSQVKEKIMGSQAVIAARQTAIPLLLIPFDATYKRIKKIVFAWDMKDSEMTIPMNLLNSLVQTLKAELLILNIDYKNKNFNKDTFKEQAFIHHSLDPGNTRCFYDDHPDAGKGVIMFAENHQADVVIVIPKKKSFPDNLFKKSTTKRLAFNIKIPLLILPQYSKKNLDKKQYYVSKTTG